MRKIFIIMLITGTIISSCSNKKYNYPVLEKGTTVDDYFGTKVADPFRILEDNNANATKEWVKAQNEVTFKYLHNIPFRQILIDRLGEIMNYERYSTPFKKAGRYFFYKNDGLQNQSVLYTVKNLNDEPEVLLDPNKLSDDGTVSLGTTAVSKNGKYLAYSVSSGGSDWREIFVQDIKTGKLLDDHIKWVKFSNITWHQDGFFYGRYPKPKGNDELTASNLNQKVYYHKLGTKQKDDILIYENPKHPKRMYGVSISSDEKYLFLYESETTSGNGLYFKDLTKGDYDFVQLAKGFDYEYSVVDHINGKILIHTNYKAPKNRLVAVDVNNYAQSQWKNVIPEQKDDVLKYCMLGGKYIIANYMHNAYDKVLFYDYKGNIVNKLHFPGIGSVGGFSCDKDDDIAFYSFSSYTIPSVVYKLNLKTGKSTVYKSPDIKGINFDDYITKQVFYTSKDGTKVPMFITHKKGIKLNGYNPTLLYGYGGFNISLTPGFSITRMLWLENGGIYVVANLRGGGEFGTKWHKSGTLKQKQNVFDDFIAAAQYLIANKYTIPAKLAIEGGSNGGLLIGAVTNQRPDLFAVAIPHVGVMDMLRYQYFTIGRAWAADYGLSEDSEMFKYLYSYSPLHNIKKDVEYPAVLVLTADRDDRVVPAHSFKYIATLQDKYDGDNPVMIRIDTKSGHGAGKPISKVIEEYADVYAFIFKNINKIPYQKTRK